MADTRWYLRKSNKKEFNLLWHEKKNKRENKTKQKTNKNRCWSRVAPRLLDFSSVSEDSESWFPITNKIMKNY